MDNTPIYSREAEEAVIGAALIAPELLDDVDIQAADFYDSKCREIWKAIKAIHYVGQQIDYLTVSNRLQSAGKLAEIGGDAAITAILARNTSAVGMETYAKIVGDDAIRRRLLATANNMARLAYDRGKDALEALGEAEKGLSGIETGGSSKTVDMAGGIRQAYEIAEDAAAGKSHTVKTGFYDIDRDVVLQAPDLAIVAGRPGSGKTAWLLTVADNVTKKGGSVLMFSLEMSVSQVHMRLNAMHSGVSVKDQREGRLTADQWSAYNQAIETLNGRKLYVNDQSGITLREMRQAIRGVRGVDLVIVDYLQLMTAEGPAENRTQEVGRISQGLKAICKDFSLPLIAAAQLSRAVEQRADREPQLSDLRESGSIEQDASIVWFINRKMDDTQASFRTAKNRDGETGGTRLQFIGARSRFESLAAIGMRP